MTIRINVDLADALDVNLGHGFERIGPVIAPARRNVADIFAEFLDDAEFAKAKELWHAHWSAVDELLAHSRRRRSLRFLGALGALAANWPRYALPLAGALRASLEEAWFEPPAGKGR